MPTFSFFAIACLLSVVSQASELVFLDPPMNGPNQFQSFDQRDAQSYCANLQARLPTARELALFATQQGAVGIVPWDEGRDFIRTVETNGTRDQFAYDGNGYKDPLCRTSQELHAAFWSSSATSKLHVDSYALVLRCDAADLTGTIDTIHVTRPIAVRCVREE